MYSKKFNTNIYSVLCHLQPLFAKNTHLSKKTKDYFKLKDNGHQVCDVLWVKGLRLDFTCNLKEETGTTSLLLYCCSPGQRSQIDSQWSAFCKHICIVTEPLSKHTKEQETFPSQKQEVSHATCSNLWEFPAGQVTNLQNVHSFFPPDVPSCCPHFVTECCFVPIVATCTIVPLGKHTPRVMCVVLSL